jgi:L-arabinose isomerase
MSFFDKNINPFMNMFEQMSQEEQDRYKKMGDYMYGIVDFETGKLIESEQDQVTKGDVDECQQEFKSILDALRSGLSIDDLTQHERELVEQYLGCLDNVLANGN